MIEAQVLGDAAVLARLGRVTPAVRARVARTLERLAIRLQGIVKAEKLSGQVLQNRTGQLRASIAYTVTDAPEAITARVGVFLGPALRYGRAHEYGFRGPVSVRAHVRTIRQAFGRPIAPRAVPIAGFTRQMNLRERAYLRGALAEFEPTALATFRADVADEVRRA
jgi:hypothetical protein